MKKILLISTLGVLIPTFTVYYLLSHKKTPDYIPANNPSWINNLIKNEESRPATSPPRSLSKCTYKNQIVYYLPSRCCDMPSIVYSGKGDVVCSPDGGLTGKGDGKCSDFFESKKNCVVIWKDSRTKGIF